MPQTRDCDFCGEDIEPGTGTMFVRKNGTTIYYCSAKCEKNADLGREARDLEWVAGNRPQAESIADDVEDEPIEAIDEETAEDADEEPADEAMDDEPDTKADEATDADETADAGDDAADDESAAGDGETGDDTDDADEETEAEA